ncbi:MarR family winged helix-turn-helix transcriptional regulator [Streptomyces ficellus]|uniref:MarR family transcriptional regulator n=1 Tax=Streptomyces ficellus TaxID=1977088 RepID=A0A6I6EZG6_9ACTN|nr:MarR family transcriptional regulator [Streptomyces ficellus]QGV76860.1 MarR family transcriptional regulator [Streptomyces ficellus]
MRSESSPSAVREAARSAREVIELLEVLWNKGRDTTSPAPVSTSQLRVLYILERDQPMNLRTLGDVLGSAPSSVSRMCDRLDALGFVERSPSSSSRRELELRLSGHGETYLQELRSRREAALLDVISAMPPAERTALATGLSSFCLATEDAADPGGATDAGTTPPVASA